ncbi:SEC-C domain-containing protein [Parafilimonas sp.]|uniref:SEC-C domain-containing protein n=1 Tax=Parafilimonas sp. TaxID=1969739 RepID=UPI003F7DDF77
MYAETENNVPYIHGELELKDANGLLVDSYFIKMQPTPEYPSYFPHVFETNGRIPVNIDWHIYTDGHCCIKSIPEEIFICRKGMTLHQFIQNEVIPYFFNQKYKELHGYFLNERSHGDKGNLEFFKDIFQTNDLRTIKTAIELNISKKEYSKVAKCFCGSGKKYSKCHRKAFRTLNVYSTIELKYFLSYFS